MKKCHKFHRSMCCFLYDNPKINHKIICLRKSFMEVFHFLNPKCGPKTGHN